MKLKSGKQNLVVTLIRPEGKFNRPLPALIFVHGWKSDQQGNIKRAAEISKSGFICLTLDLRGHGESDGKIDQFSRKDHLEDIKTAYKYLTKVAKIDKEKIGIIGSSYGAYLAAVSVNYLNFKWLVLRVPALYFNDNFETPTDKLIKDDTRAFKTAGLTLENSLAIKGVTNFLGKILIIESENDKVIPRLVIENYLKFIPKNNITYHLMKNTPHSLETQEQEKQYIEILKNWLTR